MDTGCAGLDDSRYSGVTLDVVNQSVLRCLAVALLAASVAADVEQEAYKWFQSLGYPDLKKLPFVEVGSEWGFLLEETATHYKVFTIGLATGTWDKNEWVCRRLDLKKFVSEGLALLAKKQRRSGRYCPFGHTLHRLTFRPYMLALACKARGHDDLANKLLQYVGKEAWWELKVPMLDRIKRAIAREAHRILELRLGEGSGSFRKHLERYRQWKRRFDAIMGPRKKEPQDGGVAADWDRTCDIRRREGVRKDIGILEEMVAAEEVPIRPGVDEQIRQLCYMPGHPPGFFNADAKAKPLRALLDQRERAVPRLIHAWDDKRLTRSVSWALSDGRGRSTPEVSRVGNHARGLLAKIACRRLDTKDAAEAWWRDYQTKGELAMLRETVAAGEDYVFDAAHRLLDAYPDQAEDALLAGVGKRPGLMRLLLAFETKKTTAFLYRALERPTLRVSAAWLLLAHGRKEAFDRIRKEWLAKPQRELLSFLLLSGRSEGVRTVRRHWDKLNPFAVAMILMDGRIPGFIPNGMVPTDKDFEQATEGLLVHLLSDTGLGDWTIANARTCDLAGSMLAGKRVLRAKHIRVKHCADHCQTTPYTRRFDGYDFDITAPFSKRTRQIRQMRNVWRAKNKLPPVR